MDLCFPPDFKRQLDAAEGWLGLGDHLSANEELEQIPPTLRAHPKVLLLRYEIYSKENKWAACVDIADAIVQTAPDLVDGWLKRSFALHELKRTEEAYALLSPAAAQFAEHWVIPYNLACYCTQLDRFSEAECWLKCAFEGGGEKAKLDAIDDADLEPLWRHRGDSTWKAI